MGINTESAKYNFFQLLKPYRQGGTVENKKKRNLDTITNALINRYGFPPDVAGGAILRVFSRMATEGLVFKGDGSYGSKGRELFSCIRSQADDIVKQKAKDSVSKEINRELHCFKMECSHRSKILKKRSKAYKGVLRMWMNPYVMFSVGGVSGSGAIWWPYIMRFINELA